MTAIWLVFVASLMCTSIFAVVQSNCDFVQALGFLFASSVLICLLSVAGWLAIYGLSVVLEGVEYHKTHCDDNKHWGGMADLIP